MVADEGWERGVGVRKGSGLGRGGGGKPKEMTPMAWKIPSLIVQRRTPNVPRSSGGTLKPWVTTVTMMINMLINANVLAFANYTHLSVWFSPSSPF